MGSRHHDAQPLGRDVAETFLNAQDGWLTSVDFFLTRASTDGDIQVLIVETPHGAPEFDRVVARDDRLDLGLARLSGSHAGEFRPDLPLAGQAIWARLSDRLAIISLSR